MLQSDIAVGAVDFTARRKKPSIVFHTLDSCLVFAREGHARKFVAILEYRRGDARHTITNRNIRKPATVNERTHPDARHAIRDCYARKTGAIIEGMRADARHAIRDCYARQTFGILKGTFTDTCYAIGNYNAF